MNTTTDRRPYKPTRQQQQDFIKKYFPSVLPSEAARRLLAKNDPNFTESGLFGFLATDGLDREFAIYCWLRFQKNKYDRLRSQSLDYDFDAPEPSSFAPQTQSQNWLNASIQQDLYELDRAKSAASKWDIRHWLAVVLAIEIAIVGGFLVRSSIVDTAIPTKSQHRPI